MQRFLLSTSLLLLSLVSSAQGYNFFSSDNGLSSSLVRSVSEDHNGMIWISTENGLNRYDGNSIVAYFPQASGDHSVASPYVNGVFEDERGHILVASHSGLQLYDSAKDTFSALAVFESDGSSSGQILQVLARSNGDLLAIGNTVSKVVVSDSGLSLSRAGLSSKLNYCDKVLEDSDGNLWFTKYNTGLFCLSGMGDTISEYTTDDVRRVNDIYISDSGEIYIIAAGSGLLRYEKSQDRFLPQPVSFSKAPFCISKYTSRELLIGTEGDGVKIYNTVSQSVRSYTFPIRTEFPMSTSKVHSLFMDRSGNLWIGIYQKGAIMFPRRKNNFSYIGVESTINNVIGSHAVASICADNQGTLWVGTDSDGLYGINKEKTSECRAHFVHQDGNPNSVPATIISLMVDSRGTLWIASFDSGIGSVDKHTGAYHRIDFRSLERNITDYITCMAEDDEQRLWIGTNGSGLICYDLKTGKTIDISALNRQIPLYVTSLFFAENGMLYIGTYDGAHSLDTSDGLKFSTISSDKIIYTINQQRNGSLAFGCDAGLLVWSPTKGSKLFTMSDGLPSNAVYAVQQDANGLVWLSTSNGIACLREDYLPLTNYLAEDGIIINEYNKNTSYKSSDGKIWFGGMKGITYFRPQEIINPSRKWNVRIVNMYLHNRPVRSGDRSGRHQILSGEIYNSSSVELSHSDNAFTFLFSTVEHNAPTRLQYAYKMDKDAWETLPSGVSRVSFSSLPHGKHLFKVKALDNGLESNTVELEINIHPSFWQSIPAKCLYIIVIIAILAGLYLGLIRNFRTQQKLKEIEYNQSLGDYKLKFFTDISHEIKNPLSLIINPLYKLMKTDPDPQRQHSYDIMYRNTERVLRLIIQLLDMRNIDKGALNLKCSEQDMVAYIEGVVANFSEQFLSKGIALKFSHEGLNELNLWIDPAHFDKVIANLLSNALKFTPSNGQVELRLETFRRSRKDYARILCIDNGIGLNPDELDTIFNRFYQSKDGQNVYKGGAGVGLNLARSIVELHGGRIFAENNTEGPGARFTVELLMGKSHLKSENIADAPSVVTPGESELPAPEPVVAPAQAPEVPATPKTKYKVLLVDDETELREYVAESLSTDFIVWQCCNGAEALQEIFSKNPDIVVSDVVMPKMDGLQLCDKIKQNINLNHIPVVLLTGKSKDEDTLKGLKTGADAYITKPFNIEVLRVRILNLIESRKVLRNSFTGQQVQNDKLSAPDVKTPDDKLMTRIMKALDDNLSNPELTIEMLAHEIGISRVHLHRKLKELTNQTTSDFIRNTRLAQAARILREGKQAISEVAFLVGFESQANFATAFKKLYGMTPREYMLSGGETTTAQKPEKESVATKKD